MKKSFFLSFILSLCFLSCTLLNNNVASVSFSSRNINSRNLSLLSDITLRGAHNGNSFILGKWNTYDELRQEKIIVEVGTWDFTITALYKGTSYTDTLTNIKIEQGENHLPFIFENETLTSYKASLNDLPTLYNNTIATENNNKTVSIEITDEITSSAQWQVIEETFKTPINNVTVALKLNMNISDSVIKATPKPKEAQAVVEVTLLPSSKSVGKATFENFSELKKITLNDKVSIGADAFKNCHLLTIDYKGTMENWCKMDHKANYLYIQRSSTDRFNNIGYQLKINNTEITSSLDLTKYPSITTMSTAAFRNCESLTDLIIPDTFTSAGHYAFDGCTLTNIDFKGSMKQWCEFDHFTPRLNPQTSDASYKLIIGNKEITNTLDLQNEGLTQLNDGAFKNCSKLQKVTLPDTITTVGVQVFDYCTNLTELNIPNQLTNVPEKFVYSCSSLKSITIPSTVTSIESYAFSRSGLTTISIPDSVTLIKGNAFKDCTSLTTITLNNTLKDINQGAFQNCGGTTGVAEFNLPSTIIALGADFIKNTTIKKFIFTPANRNWEKSEKVSGPFTPLDSMEKDSLSSAESYNTTFAGMWLQQIN